MRRALCLLFVVLLCLLSSIASAETVAWIKAHSKVGDIVGVEGVISADLSNSPAEPCCYISDTNGARSGIKLLGFGGLEGIFYGIGSDNATFGFLVSEDCAGEKQLTLLPIAPPMFSLVGCPQTPMFMPTRCIGGGPLCWDPGLGLGQRGPDGCCGANNVGTLIKTCGRVIRSYQSKCFYIDDGSKRWNSCCGMRGIAVSCWDFPTGTYFTPPPYGKFVTVTGISSIWCCEQGGVHSVIRLRRPGDVEW